MLSHRNDANLVILFFAKSENLGLAVVCCNRNDTAATALEKDGRVDKRGIFTPQAIDEDIEGIFAQILWVTGLVDIPDVNHILLKSLFENQFAAADRYFGDGLANLDSIGFTFLLLIDKEIEFVAIVALADICNLEAV